MTDILVTKLIDTIVDRLDIPRFTIRRQPRGTGR